MKKILKSINDTTKFKVTEEVVNKFAKVVGDNNPVHLN